MFNLGTGQSGDHMAERGGASALGNESHKNAQVRARFEPTTSDVCFNRRTIRTPQPNSDVATSVNKVAVMSYSLTCT